METPASHYDEPIDYDGLEWLGLDDEQKQPKRARLASPRSSNPGLLRDSDEDVLPPGSFLDDLEPVVLEVSK